MSILNRSQARRKTAHRALLRALSGGVLLGLACVIPAQAEPATAEGARKLTDAFKAYVSAEPFEKGFLSITPRGESYDLTISFDTDKLNTPDSEGRARLEPFVVRLTPKSDGTWALDSDPSAIVLSWTKAGSSAGDRVNIKFADCAEQGVFDPKAMIFPSLSTKCGGGALTVRSRDGDADITTGSFSVESGGKADGSGSADLQFDLKLAALNGKITDKKSDGQPTPVSFRIGSIQQSLTTTGARIGAVADLVTFLQANASKERLVMVQDELKAKLRAALPFWQDISSTSRLDDGTVDTPIGTAKIAHIEQRYALTGIVKDARYADGLSYSGLELPQAVLPAWLVNLVPTQANYSTKLSFSGLDGMAETLIRGLDATQDPPFTKTMAVALGTRFFSGQPRYELNLDVGAPIYTIKGQGQASILPEPQAGISISATGFDAAVDALSKTGLPQIQQSLLVLAFAKGLAKTGADGQLTWNVSYDVVTNKVIVNDQSFALPEPE